eukprot:4092217-Pleurochrysis_carterae.AAC.1
MRRLDTGVTFNLHPSVVPASASTSPESSSPTATAPYSQRRLRAWVVGLAADTPAAAKLTGFMGHSANKCCRQCDVSRADERYPCPCSFLPDHIAPDLNRPFSCRTLSSHKAQR